MLPWALWRCERGGAEAPQWTSSDGFLARIFRHEGKELFSEDVGEVTYHALRTKDFQEVTLKKSGEVFLHFAAAYGFRNIQNGVLKWKKGKFPYHFVEVLVCVGVCLNGRGQAQRMGTQKRPCCRR